MLAVPSLSAASSFGVAVAFTPVLNSPEFAAVFGGADGATLKTDRCGQVREVEFIAFPGAVFRILGKAVGSNRFIYRVATDEYTPPPGVELYTDLRFLKVVDTIPPPRKPMLPARDEIAASLKTAVGTPYIWGGNHPEGAPGMLRYYSGKALKPDKAGAFMLAGLDCSGLLYHATGGFTPRNSSDLVHYGRGLKVKGKSGKEIAAMLRPLDLLAWNGHLVIALDSETAIESALSCGTPGNGGVVATPLPERIDAIMKKRKPADEWPASGRHDDIFVVRRWLE